MGHCFIYQTTRPVQTHCHFHTHIYIYISKDYTTILREQMVGYYRMALAVHAKIMFCTFLERTPKEWNLDNTVSGYIVTHSEKHVLYNDVQLHTNVPYSTLRVFYIFISRWTPCFNTEIRAEMQVKSEISPKTFHVITHTYHFITTTTMHCFLYKTNKYSVVCGKTYA